MKWFDFFFFSVRCFAYCVCVYHRDAFLSHNKHNSSSSVVVVVFFHRVRTFISLDLLLILVLPTLYFNIPSLKERKKAHTLNRINKQMFTMLKVESNRLHFESTKFETEHSKSIIELCFRDVDIDVYRFPSIPENTRY